MQLWHDNDRRIRAGPIAPDGSPETPVGEFPLSFQALTVRISCASMRGRSFVEGSSFLTFALHIIRDLPLALSLSTEHYSLHANNRFFVSIQQSASVAHFDFQRRSLKVPGECIPLFRYVSVSVSVSVQSRGWSSTTDGIMLSLGHSQLRPYFNFCAWLI
jgi:hypothetical protein